MCRTRADGALSGIAARTLSRYLRETSKRSSVDDHRAGRVPCDAVGVDDIGAVDAQEAVVELLLPLRNLGLGA